mgnify:CR=1 FL=1
MLIKVSDKEKIFKVLDGTIYKICPNDLPTEWEDGNILMIYRDGDDTEYPYRIANPGKSEWVRGKRI